jgi:hypothetical protein
MCVYESLSNPLISPSTRPCQRPERDDLAAKDIVNAVVQPRVVRGQPSRIQALDRLLTDYGHATTYLALEDGW